MKNTLKKSLLILLLLFITFPTSILTACNKDAKDTNVQAFYDYAVTAKTTLDDLANDATNFFYTMVYNPNGIDLDIYTDLVFGSLKKKRATVQSDYDALSKLLA